MWDIFRKYHYLSHVLNVSSQKYVMFVDGHLAGFCAVIHFPHPKIKNMKKIHRLVVLPQFQGLGFGDVLNSWVSDYYTKQGMRMRITSTHPSLVHRCSNNPNWTFVGKKKNKDVYDNDKIQNRFSAGFRTTYTFEYTPQN